MKKAILIFLCACLVIFTAIGAVTLKKLQTDRTGFVVNGNSADLSGCETLRAGVTGKKIYLERIVISNGATAQTVTVGFGETSSDVTTTAAGPIYLGANSQATIVYTRPVTIPDATTAITGVALTADANSAGAVTINVQGYIK